MGIDALYNHEFTISRPSRVDDGQGGWAIGYEDVGTAMGRLRPASERERLDAAQRQAEISHVWYCDANVDVRRGDLVSGGDQVVLVKAVREPSHAGHHLEVDCMERQQDAEQEIGS